MQSTGSRFYVSGLFDRLAGRGLDGSTLAPLISLADRPGFGQIGRQIQDAYINPFHASFIRELGHAHPASDRGFEQMGVKRLSRSQNAPAYPRQLVG